MSEVFPVVACAPALDDAGAPDADLPDADLPDAESGASPCATPPPAQCVGSTLMVELLPGTCGDDGTCVFGRREIECPGGCFRQLDGGHHCNE